MLKAKKMIDTHLTQATITAATFETIFVPILFNLESMYSKIACECNEDGSETTQCDQDGKCTCKPNITGDKCDQSEPGYYDFPDPKGMLE